MSVGPVIAAGFYAVLCVYGVLSELRHQFTRRRERHVRLRADLRALAPQSGDVEALDFDWDDVDALDILAELDEIRRLPEIHR